MPAATEADPLPRQETLYDHGEERTEGRPSFVALKDRVVVLDQGQLRRGREVLGVRITKSGPARHSGNDALHEREVRTEQLFRKHGWKDPRTAYQHSFAQDGKPHFLVAPLVRWQHEPKPRWYEKEERAS